MLRDWASVRKHGKSMDAHVLLSPLLGRLLAGSLRGGPRSVQELSSWASALPSQGELRVRMIHETRPS